MHHDGTCATERYHLHVGQIVGQEEDCRTRSEIDRLGSCPREPRKLVEALIDPVNLARLAERALTGDDAPIARSAGVLEDQAILSPSRSGFPEKSKRTPRPRRMMRPTPSCPSTIGTGIGR
jgi:hypothetical protein